MVLPGVTALWHVAQWVSRAPPHNALPAFLNLNGIKIKKSRENFSSWRMRDSHHTCHTKRLLAKQKSFTHLPVFFLIWTVEVIYYVFNKKWINIICRQITLRKMITTKFLRQFFYDKFFKAIFNGRNFSKTNISKIHFLQ